MSVVIDSIESLDALSTDEIERRFYFFNEALVNGLTIYSFNHLVF